MTATLMMLPRGAYLELIKRLTIKKLMKVMQLDNEPSWVDSLISFLMNSMFPANQKEAYKVKY